jgi:hypothetical protein
MVIDHDRMGGCCRGSLIGTGDDIIVNHRGGDRPLRSAFQTGAGLYFGLRVRRADQRAGGAVLALVSHAMIPEAIHGGGSLVVLPTVAGFLFALYLALGASFA